MAGIPYIDTDDLGPTTGDSDRDFDIFIDQDIIVGAPLWTIGRRALFFSGMPTGLNSLNSIKTASNVGKPNGGGAPHAGYGPGNVLPSLYPPERGAPCPTLG